MGKLNRSEAKQEIRTSSIFIVFAMRSYCHITLRQVYSSPPPPWSTSYVYSMQANTVLELFSELHVIPSHGSLSVYVHYVYCALHIVYLFG